MRVPAVAARVCGQVCNDSFNLNELQFGEMVSIGENETPS